MLKSHWWKCIYKWPIHIIVQYLQGMFKLTVFYIEIENNLALGVGYFPFRHRLHAQWTNKCTNHLYIYMRILYIICVGLLLGGFKGMKYF